jgi:NADPH:quinone reductase-like Zn-dependent oxidoreductase
VAAWSGLFPAPAQGSHFGLGWDVAGTVDAVGPGAAWEVGTPVIAIVQGATGVVRAQAEYTIVPSNTLAHAPTGIDAVHASGDVASQFFWSPHATAVCSDQM